MNSALCARSRIADLVARCRCTCVYPKAHGHGRHSLLYGSITLEYLAG